MNPEWVAWAKEEIIALSKIVQEKNAEIERLKKESYANVVKLMTNGHDALTEREKQAEERVARELEGLMTAHIGRHQTAYVMQLWRERRDS